MAKFQGDRWRELGERVARKKHVGQNISPSGTAVPGDLIIIIEFVERRDDRRYRGAGVATLRICGGKIVSFQMASESKQRVARPDVER